MTDSLSQYCLNCETQANTIEELRAANERWVIAFNQAEERAIDAVKALQARVKVLEEALTPSAATKAAYMSEFSWTEPDFDECGGRTLRQIVVPWTVIKTIMATIRAQAALQETSETFTHPDNV